MPKAFPKEFREDVIRVFATLMPRWLRSRRTSGSRPSCLKRWLTIDDRELGRVRRARLGRRE